MRAALAGAILGFVPGLLDVFASPKAVVLRALGLPLLALAAARGVSRLRSGGPGAAWPRDAAGFADIAVLAWLLVSGASAVAGLAPRVSLFGEIGQREGVLTSLALAGLWFGTRASHRDAAHARGTLAVGFVASGLAGLVALAQFAGLDPLVWENPARYAGVVRPPGTLGNPLQLGVVMAAACAGGVAVLARERGTAARLVPWLAVMGAALVATLSRGAWLAAAAGLAAATVPTLARAAGYERRRALLALAAVLVPALAFGSLAAGGAVLARLAESASTEATSSPARVAIALGAFDLWRAHPWLGTGPDSFGLAFTRVQSPELWRHGWFGLPVHAHSAALQILATLGSLGALALLGWGAAVLRAWRAPRDAPASDPALRPVALALAMAAIVNSIGIAGAVSLIVIVALAVRGEESKAALSRRSGRLAAAIAIFVGVGALAAGARELFALAEAGRARAALLESVRLPGGERELACAAAHQSARRAARAWPVDDELARLECDAIVASVDARRLGPTGAAAAEFLAIAAVEVAQSAVRAVPARAANHQRVANALAARARITRESGRSEPGPIVAAMQAAFDSAQVLAPADGLLLVDRARAELSLGLTAEALATATRIASLYPEAATGHALVGAALLLRGERERARAALVRALAARWEEGADAQRVQAEWLLDQLEEHGR